MWAFLLLKIQYLLNYEIIENKILTFFRMCYKLLVVKDIIAFHIIFHIFTNIDTSHRVDVRWLFFVLVSLWQ